MDLLTSTAQRIPEQIRNVIKEKNLIDLAFNTDAKDTAMEYLFDVHAEFLDPAGEFQNFACGKCREHVLATWRKLKDYL